MTPEPPQPDDPTTTGVPLLRTWAQVYGFVIAAFVVYVVALALLPGLFS